MKNNTDKAKPPAFRAGIVLAAVGLIAFTATYAGVRFFRSSSDTIATPNGEFTKGNVASAPPGMIWIRGGEFTMGSDEPDAGPAERPHAGSVWTAFGWMRPT